MHEVGAAAEQDDLGVVGHEPGPHEPLGQVGGLVVAVGLPLHDLPPRREELHLSRDPVLRVVAEALGALDHRPVLRGIRRVGAVHRSVPVDDEAGGGIAVTQAYLSVELLEERVGVMGPFHGTPRPGTTGFASRGGNTHGATVARCVLPTLDAARARRGDG